METLWSTGPASIRALQEGFPEAKLFTAIEDYAMWLRVSALTQFDCLATPHVLYRDDPAASLRADGIEGPRQRVEILIDFLAWCRRHPGRRTWRAEIAARRHRFKHKLWRENEVPMVERVRRRLADLRHGR